MHCWITCDGTPVGTANLAPIAGLAHAVMEPVDAYASIRFHAIEAGAQLRECRHWDPQDGDFAEAFAHAWNGGRLALTDPERAELAITSVVVVEDGLSLTQRGPVVIVDARPDMARVEAFLRTTLRNGDDRSKPAA